MTKDTKLTKEPTFQELTEKFNYFGCSNEKDKVTVIDFGKRKLAGAYLWKPRSENKLEKLADNISNKLNLTQDMDEIFEKTIQLSDNATIKVLSENFAHRKLKSKHYGNLFKLLVYKGPKTRAFLHKIKSSGKNSVFNKDKIKTYYDELCEICLIAYDAYTNAKIERRDVQEKLEYYYSLCKEIGFRGPKTKAFFVKKISRLV
jgi:hypothetical protein